MKRLYVTVLLVCLLTIGMLGIAEDRAAAIGVVPPPVANAGPDQTVYEGTSVDLDGSGSNDLEFSSLSYAWNQIAGPDVFLNGSNTVNPTFVAPQVEIGGATLTFKLTVYNSDNVSSIDVLPPSEDDNTVNVVVKNINNPPVADAGTELSVYEGSPVTLYGTASYDPDGDALTFSWTQVSGTSVSLSNPLDPKPSFTAPFVNIGGETLTFKLIVNDGSIDSVPDYVDILVTNENHPPVANAGKDQAKEEAKEVKLDGTLSIDPDGDALTFSWTQVSGTSVSLSNPLDPKPSFTAPFVNTGGEILVFKLTVYDGLVYSLPDEVSINIFNVNDPPNCALAKPSVLWPPNHKMVPVAIIGVTDPDNDQVTITIHGITQDEPVNGLGDGDTSPDAAISGNNALIRSERSGLGDGRIYKINFEAEDSSGGNCIGSVAVCVPHDMRPGTTCIDSGQNFNSFKQ